MKRKSALTSLGVALICFYSRYQLFIPSLEQCLTYLLFLKESYDDLSQKDVESLSGRSLSSANGKLVIHSKHSFIICTV